MGAGTGQEEWHCGHREQSEPSKGRICLGFRMWGRVQEVGGGIGWGLRNSEFRVCRRSLEGGAL